MRKYVLMNEEVEMSGDMFIGKTLKPITEKALKSLTQ